MTTRSPVTSSSQERRPNQSGASTSAAASDPMFGVVSVLYHALQGAQTYDQYCEDARRSKDEELEQFFEECREEEAARARRAKVLLLDRLETEEELEEGDEEDEDGEAAADDEDEE